MSKASWARDSAQKYSREIHILALSEVCQNGEPPVFEGWILVSHYRGSQNRGVAFYRRTTLPAGIQVLPGPPPPRFYLEECDSCTVEIHFTDGDLHEVRGLWLSYRNPDPAANNKQSYCQAFNRLVRSLSQIGFPPKYHTFFGDFNLKSTNTSSNPEGKHDALWTRTLRDFSRGGKGLSRVEVLNPGGKLNWTNASTNSPTRDNRGLLHFISPVGILHGMFPPRRPTARDAPRLVH